MPLLSKKQKMSIETVVRPLETQNQPRYTYKSFELVFSNFCRQYTDRLHGLTGGQDKRHSMLGLPPNATWHQMSRRVHEISAAMGDAPKWDEQRPGVELKDAVLLSARYLAWNTLMGGINQQYIDRLERCIDHQRYERSGNGGLRHNLSRLHHERSAAVSVLLAQNHALRDYFDSGLARTIGNDSPDKISRLLENVPYFDEEQRRALVKGISLEIASKRCLERRADTQDYKIAYGSDRQDARGGDLVVLDGDEILFIDLKSSMPERFSNDEYSTPEDYERGYKWMEGRENEHKVVVWAYQDSPVSPESFELTDARLVHNLSLVAGSLKLDKS